MDGTLVLNKCVSSRCSSTVFGYFGKTDSKTIKFKYIKPFKIQQITY